VTAGIQQLGWATLQCQFSSEEGVGDTHNSFAYDGKRRRKWNQRAQEYGERWAPGDVVGVCIDLDACKVRSHSGAARLVHASPLELLRAAMHAGRSVRDVRVHAHLLPTHACK
jgi:hypothetical protein